MKLLRVKEYSGSVEDIKQQPLQECKTMSIKKLAFDTVVILAFLGATGLVFDYILNNSFSNPLMGNTITTEEQV